MPQRPEPLERKDYEKNVRAKKRLAPRNAMRKEYPFDYSKRRRAFQGLSLRAPGPRKLMKMEVLPTGARRHVCAL